MSLVVSNVSPAPRELFPKLNVVVDLAVVDEQVAVVIRGERLPSAREVDDREPGRDEAGPRVEREPVAVRPAMANRPRHAEERRFGDRLPSLGPHNAGDPAHGQSVGSTSTAGAWRYSVATRFRSISR